MVGLAIKYIHVHICMCTCMYYVYVHVLHVHIHVYYMFVIIVETEHQKSIKAYHELWKDFEEKMTLACRVSSLPSLSSFPCFNLWFGILEVSKSRRSPLKRLERFSHSVGDGTGGGRVTAGERVQELKGED